MSSLGIMKLGRLERIVGADGYGRLMLVATDGDTYAITRRLLRDAGSVRPQAGDAFEFLTGKNGVAQLRRISA
jgi:hypothetical protein